MPSFGQFTAASSQFANRHGIYLGRRSTKIHVALYRRSGGRMGGHLPGWPEAQIVLVDHKGAKSGVVRTSPLMYHKEGDAIASGGVAFLVVHQRRRSHQRRSWRPYGRPGLICASGREVPAESVGKKAAWNFHPEDKCRVCWRTVNLRP